MKCPNKVRNFHLFRPVRYMQAYEKGCRKKKKVQYCKKILKMLTNFFDIFLRTLCITLYIRT